jgi:arginyl-tRNA synthetase
MNIFDIYLDKIIILIKKLNEEGKLDLPESLSGINVDIPPSNFDCDISTNVSMVLSKINKKSPIEIANQIIPLIEKEDSDIESISVAKPGFINIKFKDVYWNNFVKEVHNIHKNYGINNKEKKQKYLIEFVSANPTGPLHVGHCRGAILGDVISNILIFNKHKVSKEYYVNDYGNQIINFTKSVYFRAREILYNEKFPLENADLYPGDYLIDIAKNITENSKDLNFDKFENISKELTHLSVSESLRLIKSNLESLGIIHDNFISETSIVHDKEVDKVIIQLKDKNLIYEGKIKAPAGENDQTWVEREQLLFKSTVFGDDKDRALQKSDKSWTYFASDVAYHNNKLDRKFDILINILGADHAGYIKRITSVVEALSGSKGKLICKVSQLVKLIKEGKPFKMSKRKGDYITVEDLISEVGKDATRFIMLNRSSDVELDFDFTKVKEKSKDNPLYYVQYCYARISSVFRHIDLEINKDLIINTQMMKLRFLKRLQNGPNVSKLLA